MGTAGVNGVVLVHVRLVLMTQGDCKTIATQNFTLFWYLHSYKLSQFLLHFKTNFFVVIIWRLKISILADVNIKFKTMIRKRYLYYLFLLYFDVNNCTQHLWWEWMKSISVEATDNRSKFFFLSGRQCHSRCFPIWALNFDVTWMWCLKVL